MRIIVFLISFLFAINCIASQEISFPSNTTYVVVGNPLREVYSLIVVETNQVMTSGQPLLVTGLDVTNTCTKIFSAWSLDEDGFLVSRTSREITWSKGYTQAEIAPIILAAQALMPYVKLSAIKHPDREEYALPWCQYMIDLAPDGALKTLIVNKHNESIAEGNVKTREEMLLGGW